MSSLPASQNKCFYTITSTYSQCHNQWLLPPPKVTFAFSVTYFGDNLDHQLDPGVWSPKSGFTGLSNYQRILMKFYGELGCGLETNWLHFGDDPHHYPNPWVCSGSRWRYGKNWRSAEVCALWVLPVLINVWGKMTLTLTIFQCGMWHVGVGLLVPTRLNAFKCSCLLTDPPITA